jgi:hypothetical protein
MGWFNGTATASGGSLMERLSQENHWTAVERQGNGMIHRFKGDAVTPSRDVIIVHTPGDEIAVFQCSCRASFVARSMTTSQMALFLARNNESIFGKWQFNIKDGEVEAHLRYTALAGGLNSHVFRSICLGLVGEVAFVEEALHEHGML